LAKTFEKKKENINDKLKVVFIRNSRWWKFEMTDGSNYKRSFYGTNSYMPGLLVCTPQTVIRYLLKNKASFKNYI
jgi:hypothetical protein